MTDKQIIIDGYFNIMRDDYGRIYCIQDIGDPKELIKAIREQNEYIQRKEQECEGLGQAYLETNELLQEKTKECTNLKAENEELKRKVESYICSTNCYKYEQAEKLKQTLTEIKEIANRIYSEVITENWQSLLAKQILQKISECEVEDE